MLNIEVDYSDLRRAEAFLKNIPGGIEKAKAATMKRVLPGMQADLTRLTRERYRQSAGALRSSYFGKVSSNGLNMHIRGRRLSLANYYMTPKKGRKKTGLKGAVRSGAVKNLPGAFLIKGYPFVRIGKKRWDIRPVISPAIPQIVQNPEITKLFIEHSQELFTKRLNHEIMRIIGVYKK